MSNFRRYAGWIALAALLMIGSLLALAGLWESGSPEGSVIAPEPAVVLFLAIYPVLVMARRGLALAVARR